MVIAVTTTPAPRHHVGRRRRTARTRPPASSAPSSCRERADGGLDRVVAAHGAQLRQHRRQRPHGGARLHAAAEHAHAGDVRAGEIAGGDADARAGAPGGDRAGVHHGRGQPGPGVAQHDQAVGDRQTGGGVPREQRDPLGAEAAVTRQRRRHDLGVRVALAVQAELGRHDHLSPALGGAAALDGVDDLEHASTPSDSRSSRDRYSRLAAGRPVRLARPPAPPVARRS